MNIYEVHETTNDGRDWLSGILKHLHEHSSTHPPQRIQDMFTKAAICGISGCSNRVEVGAHVTIDGAQLLIVPTCSKHNGQGVLDKLARHARLKAYQGYAMIHIRPGTMVENGEGKFFLKDVLPNVVDFF